MLFSEDGVEATNAVGDDGLEGRGDAAFHNFNTGTPPLPSCLYVGAIRHEKRALIYLHALISCMLLYILLLRLRVNVAAAALSLHAPP